MAAPNSNEITSNKRQFNSTRAWHYLTADEKSELNAMWKGHPKFGERNSYNSRTAAIITCEKRDILNIYMKRYNGKVTWYGEPAGHIYLRGPADMVKTAKGHLFDN